MYLKEHMVLGLTLDHIVDDSTVSDQSSNNISVSVHGEPSVVVDDQFGHCLGFNGTTSQYLKVADFDQFPTDQLTVACWLKLTKTDRSDPFISYANERSANAFLVHGYDQENHFVANTRGEYGHGLIKDGLWHHVAVTWSKATGIMQYYIDGVLKFTSSVINQEAIAAGGCLIIGQEQDSLGGGFSSTQCLDGQLAHYYLYDRVLNKGQIAALIQDNVTYYSWSITDGLVMGLSMDEILDDNTVADISTNGVIAQVVGEPTLVPDDHFGSCLHFNGTDKQYIKVADFALFPSEQLTVACWLKLTNTGRSDAFISYANELATNAFLVHGYDQQNHFFVNGSDELGHGFIKDGLWHHVAVTWSKATGFMQFYIDGVLKYTSSVISQKAILAGGCLIIGQEQDSLGGGFSSTQNLDGELAHYYLYDRVLKQSQIIQLSHANANAQVSFKTEFPIEFNMLDDGEDNIFYINDSQSSNLVQLQLKNSAGLNVLIPPGNVDEPSSEHYHFSLTFQAKTFEQNLIEAPDGQQFIIARNLPEGWLVSPALQQYDGQVVVYILYRGSDPLHFAHNSRLTFEFEYASADGDLGARGTNVMLSYRELSYENRQGTFSGNRLQKMDIINQRGKKNLPLIANIVGSHTILNDARAQDDADSTASSIVIRLVNTLSGFDGDVISSRLGFNRDDIQSSKNTRFTIRFDDPIGVAWDLASNDHLKAIVATASYSSKPEAGPESLTAHLQGVRPVFSFTPTIDDLSAGEFIDITLSNIRSNYASGFANIYIEYEDIPGYWDGRFVVQVEKTPIVHREVDGQRNVGIGKAPSSSARLDVAGDVVFNGNLGIGKLPANTKRLDVEGDAAFSGNVDIAIMTGAAQDYNKAQHTISGGGIISWHGPGTDGGLAWTRRFIAISAECPNTFSGGLVNFEKPTSGIPASQVYDGTERNYDAQRGLRLDIWEALYAVHNPGGGPDAIEYRIVKYKKEFRTKSNWFLIAICNGESNSVKLANGLTLTKGETVDTSKGVVPHGVIVMWSGDDNEIPAGWALCNGSNGTPDLRDRFVVGAGSGSQYQSGNTGGADSVTLTTNQMPSHNHSGRVTGGQHGHVIPTNSSSGGLGWGHQRIIRASVNGVTGSAVATGYAYTLENPIYTLSPFAPQPPSGGRGHHTHTIEQSGGDDSHENRPPYYALCYIMKL